MKKNLWLVLLLFALSAKSFAQWGPDANLQLNEMKSYTLTVPAGHQVNFNFTSNAFFENAILIYPNTADPTPWLIRGNYSRSLADWVAPVMPYDYELVITGWHKLWKPFPKYPWYQSDIRLNRQSQESIEIGFEDDIPHNASYDDITVSITIKPND